MGTTWVSATDRSGTAPSLRAVLFDMDGTLVETEQYWGQAMFELARVLGGRMSEAARTATVGASLRRAMTILHADPGLVRTEGQLQSHPPGGEDRAGGVVSGGISWGPRARGVAGAGPGPGAGAR